MNNRPVSEAAGVESYTQAVASYLRRAIADGRLKPGAPIRQEAVARELGVSRIPVREALRQLESEGVVVIRPNSGARVAVFDFEEYVEIYKMRERLEPLAFHESAQHITEAHVETARQLAEKLELLAGDPDAWLAADRELHLAFYAGLSTERLLRMIVGFWNTTQSYRRLLLTTFTEEDYAIQHADHRLLVHSLATRNPRPGEEILRYHIERSRMRLSNNQHLFAQ